MTEPDETAAPNAGGTDAGDAETVAGAGSSTPVSMSKVRAPSDPVPAVTPPRTIELAQLAIGVVIVGLIGRSLGLLGSTNELLAYLDRVNREAKSPDKPVSTYLARDGMDALHNLRTSGLVEGTAVAVGLVLLALALRRTRTASPSRWALLIILVLTGIPLYVIPISGYPSLAKYASMLAGIAAIAALVLIFFPQSLAYFRECREALTPPELRGAPRQSIFAPRRPVPRSVTDPIAVAPATTRPARAGARAGRPPVNVNRSRAKSRLDPETPIPTSQASSRARSAKSRRSE